MKHSDRGPDETMGKIRGWLHVGSARQTALPAYNVQTAVDAEHTLIIGHAVVLDASDRGFYTGIRCLFQLRVLRETTSPSSASHIVNTAKIGQ